MDTSNIEYKVTEVNKEDPKATVIEKHGDVVKFNLYDIETSERQLGKMKTELEAQVKLEGQKMENIETHHPVVKEMDDKTLFAAGMYQQSRAIKKASEDKLKEVVQVLEEYQAEKELIYSKFPELRATPKPVVDDLVPSPYPAEDKPNLADGEEYNADK